MQLWVLRLSVTALTTFWTGRAYADGLRLTIRCQNEPELVVLMLRRRAPGAIWADQDADE